MGVARADQFIWSDAAIARLKKLWAEGGSASLIAAALSDGSTGPSRSAVLGKVHRMKLSARASPPREKRAARITSPASDLAREEEARRQRARAFARALGWRHSEPKPGAPPRIEAPPADCRPCSLLELTDDTCRWPIGDPDAKGFFFCGAPPLHKRRYCAHHDAIAHEREDQCEDPEARVVDAGRRAA